ncbi:Aldehyde dehydrogenase (NAD(+)) [Lentibacillus sp. JNUCC-1]|uniref:aldehyde dehydrogenase family protein n=1 Tax=Lentibacillus sp. JNUCC-1 TaxID=2654513 RepID=UPI0012E9797D|nr:aldehyde dehydrogenase family protein [Lentibacillus sp. JNUCC-1]MUV38824.1 Aldehyde dehydrogenase (NAD(+)) [Lentibacillus sp. JNUCC-1]
MIAEKLIEKMLIGGKWTRKSETIDVYNPETNEVIGTIPKSTREDMEKAIQKAKEAKEKNGVLPVHERIEILQKAAGLVRDRSESFAEIIALEGSKTITEARGEVGRTASILQMSAEEARRINGETIAFDQVPGSENREGYYKYEPVGIIGAITAFNDPLNLVAHKVGPGLAAGNHMIVKPTSETPFSALHLAEVLLEAGLPSGMLSVVTGSGSELGEPLVNAPDIGMIVFTGGLETGEHIADQGGITKLQMELGSNSPVIVAKDAKLENAVASSVGGAFGAAGQNCLGVQRIYVHEDMFEDYTKQFVEQTKKLKMGAKMSEDTDIGPMISEDAAKRIDSWVKEAKERGAKIHCGGERDGAYYAPTVLTNVPTGCKVVHEEAFGPVVSLFPVADFEEAIERANAVNYGLQAEVFTQDIDKAHEAINKLVVGGVMINDSSDYRIDAMPFGGRKGSGIGREGIQYAVESMSEKKVVCFNLAK